MKAYSAQPQDGKCGQACLPPTSCSANPLAPEPAPTALIFSSVSGDAGLSRSFASVARQHPDLQGLNHTAVHVTNSCGTWPSLKDAKSGLRKHPFKSHGKKGSGPDALQDRAKAVQHPSSTIQGPQAGPKAHARDRRQKKIYISYILHCHVAQQT